MKPDRRRLSGKGINWKLGDVADTVGDAAVLLSSSRNMNCPRVGNV